MLPISIVDGKAFRDRINLIEPAYRNPSSLVPPLPGRIESFYKELKAELVTKLATAGKLVVLRSGELPHRHLSATTSVTTNELTQMLPANRCTAVWPSKAERLDAICP